MIPTQTESVSTLENHSESIVDVHLPQRMIRLRPTQSLGERFPAMHLVRSSWFARIASRVLFLFLVGFSLAAIFLPWQQTSRCDGEVVPRLPQMRRQVQESGTKGVIKYIKPGIREGDMVQEGELIMEIEPFSKDQFKQLKEQVALLERVLELSYETLDNTRSQIITETDRMIHDLESVESKVSSLEQKVAQAEAKWRSQDSEWQQAKVEVDSARELVNKTITGVKFREMENNETSQFQRLLETQAAHQQAIQDVKQEERGLASKRKDVETKQIELDSKVQKAESEVRKDEQKLSDLKVKLGEADQLKIYSPSSGRIQAIFGQASANNVKEGDKLFEIVPDTSDMAVELEVRGLDRPLIEVGKQVRLQFDGWPAIQFVGWPSVAVGTFGGRVIAISPSNDSKGDFKIMVGPDPDNPEQEKWPESRYIRQGVRANGWVILGTVPLGYEVWRQLNGFQITTSNPGEKEKAKDPKLPKFK
jgi:multidrug resistance efflux pump